MDKNAIKKYAVWARRELISRVSQRAALYDISEEGFGDPAADSVRGRVLTPTEKQQRQALIAQIQQKGYREVMEEVAYTWFNRFAALRFMEVNGYLPSRVRVFTDENNAFNPQILTEAIHLDMDGLDMEKVYAFKDANDKDGLFKYLLITQCNALSPILPGMFQRIADETELLFPDNLLREGSVIEQMITQIDEEDWKDAVQIIGWLYQYYNSEKKDKVFADLKKNIKITKENIPAATQLFTPDWIVRYMVENSLGRLWVEGHPNDDLKSSWKYYLDEAEQELEVQAQLAQIRKGYAALTPEQIKVIDPCCGSGHILAYLFDVLMQIYESYGYTTREAVASILAHNLYGLDIDDRAAQLSYFAVMMKARQYDRRFLTRKDEDGNPHVPQPNVYAICESNTISRGSLKYFGWSMSDIERNMALSQLTDLLDAMEDAKEYGSILIIKDYDWELLYRFVGTVDYSGQLDFDAGNLEDTKEKLWRLVEVAATMAQKYDVVVTNPPYLGSDAMSTLLTNYIKKKYPLCKADIFAAFMERCSQMLKRHGYQAMITMHAWMFLSSFEKLREHLVSSKTIISMCHLGARAFEAISGEIVQTVAWISKNGCLDYKANYARLVDYSSQDEKEEAFVRKENRCIATQKNFANIPGSPIAYWFSDGFKRIFEDGEQITEYVSSRDGLTTGNNELFIRQFWEVSYSNIEFNCNNADEFWNAEKRFAPLIKGGLYRKWYGNNWFVITYDKAGYNTRSNMSEKKPRKLKVYGQSGYKYRDTPTIILKGKWLTEAGFEIGDPIEVELTQGKIVIKSHSY